MSFWEKLGLFKNKKNSEPFAETENRVSVYKKTKEVQKANKERSYSELSKTFAERMNSSEEVVLHNVDPMLLILFSVLIGFAFIVSLSATNSYADTFYDDKFYFFFQNIKFIAFGLLAMGAAIYFAKSLRTYSMFILIGFVIVIILLMLVLLIGTEAGGAKRWLQIGPFSLQPSELAKTVLVAFLALFMSANHDKITNVKDTKRSLLFGVVIPIAVIGLLCGLVFLEKHNSGMIILAAIGISVMFVGGTPKRWFFAIIIIGGIALAVLMLSTGHGVDRIMNWLNSDAELNDGNWQTTQGLYAISSGGLFGLGPGQSRLKYGYVSQPQNDFIFPIICEELGFVGGVAVLILFFAIFLREMKIGLAAKNMFVSITICGLAVKLILQVILNICVVTALIPNTGISLPLFSAGGSAMIIQMLEFGVVLGLSRYCDVK